MTGCDLFRQQNESCWDPIITLNGGKYKKKNRHKNKCSTRRPNADGNKKKRNANKNSSSINKRNHLKEHRRME